MIKEKKSLVFPRNSYKFALSYWVKILKSYIYLFSWGDWISSMGWYATWIGSFIVLYLKANTRVWTSTIAWKLQALKWLFVTNETLNYKHNNCSFDCLLFYWLFFIVLLSNMKVKSVLELWTKCVTHPTSYCLHPLWNKHAQWNTLIKKFQIV